MVPFSLVALFYPVPVSKVKCLLLLTEGLQTAVWANCPLSCTEPGTTDLLWSGLTWSSSAGWFCPSSGGVHSGVAGNKDGVFSLQG